MFGAIIGDIVGSIYEWHNNKTKEFPLFRDDCLLQKNESVSTTLDALCKILDCKLSDIAEYIPD